MKLSGVMSNTRFERTGGKRHSSIQAHVAAGRSTER